MQQIIIGSDHAGFALKEELKQYLENVVDVGTNSDEMCNFPTYTKKLVDKMRSGGAVGIFCCGSGIGPTIMANRTRGIRAAVAHTQVVSQMARQQNDINLLVLPSRLIEVNEAKTIVDIFLETPFLGGRYSERNNMIEA